MLPEKKDVNIPKHVEENNDDTIVEEKITKRASRSREDIENLFVSQYGLEEGSDSLKKLVDREIASSKSLSKVLRQKISLREKLGGNTGGENPAEKKEEETSSFERIRGAERKKAVEKFLNDLSKKHKDLNIEKAYESIKGKYKESGDETRREDFIGNLGEAFKLAYPERYEEEIRAKERKRLLEDDNDIPLSSGGIKGESKDVKKRGIFKGGTNIKDWYAPKK